MNIYSAITALPLKRLLISKNNHLLFNPNSLKHNGRVMRMCWWQSLFFIFENTVSVLTISMFDEYLYKRVRKRIYLENQSQ